MNAHLAKNCPLCSPTHEQILWQNEYLRVIAVPNEKNAPAVCRVIWRDHIAEMTDLSPTQRHDLMNHVYAVEHAMRLVLQPSKINLASLGNVVPHLHWHIIARFEHDACFPAPIWAEAVREPAFRLPENWIAAVQQQLEMILSD